MLPKLSATFLLWIAPLAGQHAASFDHGPFEQLLRAYVTEAGLVDYDAFAAAPEFITYLESLARADLDSLPGAERLALWINAYNAYTIQLIVTHDERSSIRNINKTLWLFSGSGPWNERLADVGGRNLTLDEIEHEIIREEFDEPRVHFALVCAALGCPPLRQEAYVGARLDAQLDDQALRFLTGQSDKNRVDLQKGKVYLSPILDWYRDDFPDGDAGLGAFLAEYFAVPEIRDFLRAGNFDVEHTRYDWGLNAKQ